MRIAFCREDGERMPDYPKRQASDPQPQAEFERRRNRAIDDRDGSWGTGQEDRLSERAVQRHLEPLYVRAHDTSAPPPNEKKVRKKLDAAKAIDMPNTI